MNLGVQLEQMHSKFHRSRNVGWNMVYGFINRCVSLLLPFLSAQF